MTYVIGKGYFGTANITTTNALNQEVLRPFLPTVTYGGATAYKGAYKLSFKPFLDCHIQINGGAEIFLEADTLFNTDYYDLPINSLVVKELGTQYLLWGAWD